MDGILFKFAKDVPLPGLVPTMFMYGGEEPNDEAAGRAAGHERKCVQQILVRSGVLFYHARARCV